MHPLFAGDPGTLASALARCYDFVTSVILDMNTLTVKLPAALNARLEALVRARKQSKSALVREALERLVEESAPPAKASVLDLVGDLAGIGDGPRDLSSNPKHMRGFGEPLGRGPIRTSGKK